MTAEHAPIERAAIAEDRGVPDHGTRLQETGRLSGGTRSTSAAATRRRLRALLSAPAGLRSALLAKEVLDPPVAMRPRRR